MKALYFYSLTVLNILISYTEAANIGNSTTAGVCSLTGLTDANPFPSLIKCYKYNSDSCCSSVHDDFIYTFMGNLLTNSCVRRYPELEDFVCYGCNPREYEYTNRKNNVLNFCLSYALRLWNGTVISDLNSPSKRFDNCGIKVSSSSSAALQSLTSKPYLIPSEAFPDFYSFVNTIGVPFFDNFTVNVIDDTNITDTTDVCYSAGQGVCYNAYLFIFTFIIIMLAN